MRGFKLNAKYQIEVQAKIIYEQIKKYEENKVDWKQHDEARRKALSQKIAKQAYDHFQATQETLDGI